MKQARLRSLLHVVRTTSEISYAIVEFSQIGIQQFDSAVPITHSIVRYTNSEGLYAERSSPVFAHNLLYGNGYHEIALEQYNSDVVIRGNVFRDGHFGIHLEETSALVEGNLFAAYPDAVITLNQHSEVTFEAMSSPTPTRRLPFSLRTQRPQW